MRFFVEYDIENSHELPLDYRRCFVNMVKTALEIGSNYNIELSAVEIDRSPLCFAIRFDQRPQISGQKLFIGKNLRLYFSSPSLILGSVLYNGLLDLKQFTVFNTKLTNPRASYIKEDHIAQDTIMLKTLSPIVIRDHRRKERYVLPNEDAFTESFMNALAEQWMRYHEAGLDFENNNPIRVSILRFKKVVMTHYGGLVPGIYRQSQARRCSRSIRILLSFRIRLS